MSGTLKAEYIEHGILSRDKPATDANADGWALLHVPEFPLIHGMFYRVRLADSVLAAVRDIIVVAGPTGCVDAALAEPAAAATSRVFADSAVAVFLKDGPGTASVQASGRAADAAVAVAVVKHAAGWDEASSFAIRVGSRMLSVGLTYRKPHFEARVSEEAVEQSVAADVRGASDGAHR